MLRVRVHLLHEQRMEQVNILWISKDLGTEKSLKYDFI